MLHLLLVVAETTVSGWTDAAGFWVSAGSLIVSVSTAAVSFAQNRKARADATVALRQAAAAEASARAAREQVRSAQEQATATREMVDIARLQAAELRAHRGPVFELCIDFVPSTRQRSLDILGGEKAAPDQPEPRWTLKNHGRGIALHVRIALNFDPEYALFVEFARLTIPPRSDHILEPRAKQLTPTYFRAFELGGTAPYAVVEWNSPTGGNSTVEVGVRVLGST